MCSTILDLTRVSVLAIRMRFFFGAIRLRKMNLQGLICLVRVDLLVNGMRLISGLTIILFTGFCITFSI